MTANWCCSCQIRATRNIEVSDCRGAYQYLVLSPNILRAAILLFSSIFQRNFFRAFERREWVPTGWLEHSKKLIEGLRQLFPAGLRLSLVLLLSWIISNLQIVCYKCNQGALSLVVQCSKRWLNQQTLEYLIFLVQRCRILSSFARKRWRNFIFTILKNIVLLLRNIMLSWRQRLESDSTYLLHLHVLVKTSWLHLVKTSFNLT